MTPTPPLEAAELATLRGAVARGWCADKNRHKEMDSDLAEAIVQEIVPLLTAARDAGREAMREAVEQALETRWNSEIILQAKAKQNGYHDLSFAHEQRATVLKEMWVTIQAILREKVGGTE